MVVYERNFRYQGHENDAGIPQAHGTIAPAQNNQDLCLDFDADEIFGSAAYAIEACTPLKDTCFGRIYNTFNWFLPATSLNDFGE